MEYHIAGDVVLYRDGVGGLRRSADCDDRSGGDDLLYSLLLNVNIYLVVGFSYDYTAVVYVVAYGIGACGGNAKGDHRYENYK